MQNCLLKPLIQRIKNQDMTAFPLIFEQFKRLISLYAERLCYEDAASELTLFFIELLYDTPLSKFPNDDGDELQRYIAVSIKNKYIALSVARSKKFRFEKDFIEENWSCSEQLDDHFWFVQGIGKLNDAQKMIIVYHFIYGYSIVEIAERLNVSRQAVNKTKNQALEILRKGLTRDDSFFV